uniref:DNA topoisomerase n=1 Tax=Panagrolaimus davidi TaxID=227884 RepID=A0A914QAY9_9BILA
MKIKQCEVVQVSKSNPISEPSPPGLNSFELLKFLSRYLRIDSSAAAQVAQHLYEIGLISYPRSESTKYSYDFVVVLEQLYHNLKIVNGTNVSGRYENRIMEVIEKMEIDTIENAKNKGVDSLDHPPITPTQKRLINYDESGQRRYSNNQYLNNTDKIVYNFIVRRFLAIFMDAYSYCKNAVKFKVGRHEFEYSFFTTQKAGFTELLPELIKNGTNDKNLSFNIGSKFPFDVKVKEIPMPFLEEYELIQNMEDHNIGTDGSIPNHIAVIERVKYVKIDNDTFTLEPELLGTLLVNAYKDCIPDLINPKCRARFIKDIRCIASGEKSFTEVYEKYLKEFDENFQRLSKALFLYFNEHVDKFRGCFPNNKCVTEKRR